MSASREPAVFVWGRIKLSSYGSDATQAECHAAKTYLLLDSFQGIWIFRLDWGVSQAKPSKFGRSLVDALHSS